MALLKTTTSATLFGQLCQNVMYFNYSSPGPTYLEDMAVGISTGFINAIKGYVIDQVLWNSVVVTDISAGSGGPTYTLPIAIAGTGGGDNRAPLNVAFVLRFQSGLSGRKNRGRIFIPGISANWLSTGFVDAARLAAWATPLANLTTNFITSGSNPYKLVIHGRTDSGSTFVPVTSITLRQFPGSMRRRMVGVGI